jgi:hypothetical protein
MNMINVTKSASFAATYKSFIYQFSSEENRDLLRHP